VIGQSVSVPRFDAGLFVKSCVIAAADSEPLSAVREVVLRAVSEPAALAAAFSIPLPDDDNDGVLYGAADLLVACALFPRSYSTGIHDHTVPAVIGVWSGYEDNHLFERGRDGLRALGVQRVHAGEVLVLSGDAIHDVHTPNTTHSAALHVYLGDITATRRSFWNDTESKPVQFDGEEHERLWRKAALATGLVVPAGDSNPGP